MSLDCISPCVITCNTERLVLVGDLQPFALTVSVCGGGGAQGQVSPFLQQVFMPLVLAIFEVLGRPAEDNDQAAALEKQMLRRSYFTFIQTIASSGMNEVMAGQGQ